MADPETPVRKLTFVSHGLYRPLEVDLPPWKEIPEKIREGLDRLDANDDGQLVVDTGVRPSGFTYVYAGNEDQYRELRVEVGTLDGTQQTFLRYFWAYAGDSPFNHAGRDLRTRSVRTTAVYGVQDEVFQKVVQPLMGGCGCDPLAWEEVGQTLETMADYRHLYEVAREKLYPLWEKTKDRKLLYLADRFFLEARRYAAATNDGREKWFDKISTGLKKVGGELDRLEQRDFGEAKKGPYLLSNRGAPFTVEEGEGGPLVFRVSVPKNYPAQNLVDWFQKNPLLLRPSRFQGKISLREPIPLTPVGRVEKQGLDNDSYVDHRQVSEITFGEEGRRDFLVAFRLPKGVDVAELREGLPGSGLTARSYDITQRDSKGGVVREVRGGVVFQKTRGQRVRIAFASDLHIAERDYTNRRAFILEWRKELRESRRGDMGPRPFLREGHYRERIERFYRSINESVQALVAVWNERYRLGELDKVFLAGDLADFINIAAEMKRMGLRGTNLHRLLHILDGLEPPLELIWGNHDPHIVPYALSYRKEYYPDDREIYEISKGHAGPIVLLDRANLGTEVKMSLAGLSIKGLLDTYCEEDSLDCYLEAGRRMMQADIRHPRLEGMQPHFQNFQSASAFTTSVQGKEGGRTFLPFYTGIENFGLKRHYKEGIAAPVLANAFRDAETYLGDMAASASGPAPETLGFVLRTIEEVRRQRGRVTLVGHYGVFNGGIGPGGAPSTVDTMQGEAAWFFRLIPYYYVYRKVEDGLEGPVVDSFISGHTHRTGVFTYRLNFTSPEEEATFRGDLGALFSRLAKDSSNVYEEMAELVAEYGLNGKIEIPGAKNPKEHNQPEKAIARMDEINQGSRAYGVRHGAVFVSLPAAGPPTGDAPPGFVTMTINPDGQFEFHPWFVRLEPDGRILQGKKVEPLRREHDRIIAAWRRSVGLPVIERGSPKYENLQRQIPLHGDPVILPDYEKPDKVPEKEPSIDSPWITNKVGWWSLQAGYLGGVDSLDGRWKSVLEAQLSIPLSRTYRPIGLNALLLGVLHGHGRLMGEAGIDLGLLQLQAATDIMNIYAVSAAVQWPIPAIFLPAFWGSYDRQRDEYQALFGFKLELTPFSLKF